jgi:predicted acylesterase/phospholipase RssA
LGLPVAAGAVVRFWESTLSSRRSALALSQSEFHEEGGSAHVGIYKAFRELGVVFDIFVGTSVGSAMVAGFAKNFEAEDLERGTHDIFVKSRSFRRPTWPRYALLDHKGFRSCTRRSIRPRLPDRGLLAAVRGGRNQSFDP